MQIFIRDQKFLEESVSDEDLLDFSNQKLIFSEKIDRLNSGLLGLVADFGKGKSTLIHQVRASRKDKDEKWVNFEAWDMPERRELWEGFVLEMARDIDSKTFNETRKSIEGAHHKDTKTLINTLADIPGFAVLKNLNHFLDTSPARRVFEIQELLVDLINKKCKESKIIIVAEDIDRSGPNGIFFVETLKNFIKKSELNKKVIVITPIAEKSFFDNQESYLKCLDVIEFLDYSQIKLDKFFRTVLSEDISANSQCIELMSQFFERILTQFPDTTLRKVKLILRKASITYALQEEAGLEPDWRITILVETTKFFKKENSTISFFDEFKRNRIIPKGLVFASFLTVILNENSRFSNYRPLIDREGRVLSVKADYSLIERQNSDIQGYPSVPWVSDWDPQNPTYSIVDFYFRY